MFVTKASVCGGFEFRSFQVAILIRICEDNGVLDKKVVCRSQVSSASSRLGTDAKSYTH